MKSVWLWILFLAMLLLPWSEPKSDFHEDSAQMPFALRSDFGFRKQDPMRHLTWSEESVSDREMAKTKMREGQGYLERLLDRPVNFYTGNASRPEFCEKQNLPPIFSAMGDWGEALQFAFYSTDNFVLGLCTDFQHVRRTQLLLLYCASTRKLYSIKYFYPPTESWLKDPVAYCRRLTNAP